MVGYVFLVFVIALLLGVPIGISIGITALSASIFNPSFSADAMYVFRNMVTGVDSYSLLAVPLFVLSGNLMAAGGISKKIFNFFAYFVGDKTAGLPIATIITCLFYGAISGSAPATVAAVGAMTIPLLVSLGYDKKWVVALVAVSGGLGVIIPPSIPFIVYGLSSGESVGALFISGILPGLLIGACLMLYSYFYCKNKGEDKEKLMKNYQELRQMNFLELFKSSFWALLSPVIILGGIYSGIVTPTEAADISVIYAIIVSVFIYKTMKFRDLKEVMKTTILTTGPIMLIVSTAVVFGRTLTLMQAPQQISVGIMSLVSSQLGVILMLIGFLLLVGMVMDTIAAILILTPIFIPIVNAVGINPIHFGVIMVVTLAIGFVTPPVGVNLYIASSISGLPVLEIAKKAVPFVLAFLIALLIIAFVPWLSLVFI